MSLLINPSLQKTLSDFASNPPSGILITGPKGSGKSSLAVDFANNIASNKENSKILKIVQLPDKKHILIDQIKDIKKVIKNKDNAYRTIVIPDAEVMTLDAQNSLLKVLEEPPANVIFILTSSLPHLLLKTVLSRVITIKYIKPNIEQIKEYTSVKNIPEQQAQKYYQISQGRMAIFSALVNDDKQDVLSDIEEAKEILSESPKERLSRVDLIAKDPDKILRTIDSLMLICESALDISVKKGQYQSWLKRLKALNDSYELLLKNVSSKLVLAKLFLVL